MIDLNKLQKISKRQQEIEQRRSDMIDILLNKKINISNGLKAHINLKYELYNNLYNKINNSNKHQKGVIKYE